ncbi:MAG: glycosyltransferase [Prevotellaceae bacterium]|nr:glycosyltransferase [Prevotellaceae bacterium]
MIIISKPHFSITIPAYKSAFLQEAIESCLAQTYKDFELIIVDDASPEDIIGIVGRFDDDRIRYYRNEKNCGAIDVVDNWNICLSYARGEYIICMGDDDRLPPCCLEEYARMIEEYPEIGLLHGWTEIIDEHSKIVELSAPRPLWESAYSVAWNRWENRHHQYIGDWCFSVEWLRRQGGFYKLPLAWGSDDISAIIGASKNGVVNSQRPCFQYRNHSSTITNGGNVSIKMDAVRMEREWFEKFLSEKPADELDCIYHKMLLSNIQKHFEQKYGTTIAWNLNNSIFRIFRYYRLRKEYGYTCRSLGYAIQSWIRYKFKTLLG